ncbi:unnamed protein product [Malassezia sympodialis ATCC 42132]|uniref:Similar to S.cerevisiae protein ALD5 (Mitochondrial aldehyde dehydrogenase) n=1 Tax=Malassezia sympodialis (strain ATCC 42132) TaxID=1230383 RepID=M5E7S5_MALS4|nr:uncharacterized protein MSY001_0862 [Malassezia sympodialis ATCC 42132]CCU98156.1 unnamed protein product [Malassezia sympodialis ATCC 42132]SHO76076.1 Similar to S.cerevisiae protein ALD5 (Mitochondrial aldehyde dehydrogenase) [Malassezia sympodialis ATCC 42132]|eukprot:XP_018739477.1 uncharacterized protein MSY001_0862 [Malassezia sympodialis ATCC 42132]
MRFSPDQAGPARTSLASAMSPLVPQPTLFIDGQWCASSDGRTRPTINPFDASVIMEVDEASAADAQRAAAAAKRYFQTSDWARRSCADRCVHLQRMADLLQSHKAELAKIETIDTGKTLGESEIDIDDVTNVFRFYAEEACKLDHEKRITGPLIPESVKSTIVHEPVGVCVLITPWNYPILQLCWKLAPALATGNCVIIKPSEVTPLSTVYLTRLLLDAGFPAGAVQLLTATGASVGPVLTACDDVDLVSFTGGLMTGRSIIRSCAESVKRCTVELGGKNPNVVFADCDLDWAIDNVVTAVFVHSGQVCSAGARLIVEEPIADALVAGVVKRANQIVMGNGLDPASETGPLVSQEHLAKVQSYVDLARKEGAKVLCGGTRPDPATFPHLAKGYFFLPTVIDGCDRTMRIVQEETFGPILTVERFPAGDEETAVMLANDTKYGLAGGVQSRDQARAERVARRLRHGTVWTNTYGTYTAQAEWGGYGMSGNGRELGSKGLDEYVEVKHLWSETKPSMMGWFKGARM